MDYSEKDIEDILFGEVLCDMGLTVIDRQVNTQFGVIDILAALRIEANIYGLVVIEIKKGTVDESAFGQILRYMGCVHELVEYWKNNKPEENIILKNIKGVRGLLVGRDCTEGVKILTRKHRVDFMKYRASLHVELDEETFSRNEESLEKDYENLTPLIKQVLLVNNGYHEALEANREQGVVKEAD